MANVERTAEASAVQERAVAMMYQAAAADLSLAAEFWGGTFEYVPWRELTDTEEYTIMGLGPPHVEEWTSGEPVNAKFLRIVYINQHGKIIEIEDGRPVEAGGGTTELPKRAHYQMPQWLKNHLKSDHDLRTRVNAFRAQVGLK